MANQARSIASLTISFGLVAIPVKLYFGDHLLERISFNLLRKKMASRVKQQYVGGQRPASSWNARTWSRAMNSPRASTSDIRVREGHALWGARIGPVRHCRLKFYIRGTMSCQWAAEDHRKIQKIRSCPLPARLPNWNGTMQGPRGPATNHALRATTGTSRLASISGAFWHLEGLLREAEAIYRGTDEPSAILYFNLGILLEDLQRDSDAIAAYREAIVHDPAMADAHFNLSLLHERAGEAQASFRHLLAYRRLAEQFGS